MTAPDELARARDQNWLAEAKAHLASLPPDRRKRVAHHALKAFRLRHRRNPGAA